MKRRFIALLPLAAFVLYPLVAHTDKDGAEARRTGAPGNDTCATSGCHDDGTPNSGPGSVTVSASTSGPFAPGDTVEFTVTVAETGLSVFGFQATVKKASNSGNTGRLLLAPNTEYSDAIGDYITHSKVLESNNTGSWTLRWVAPDTNPGDVIIYAAGVASNASGSRFGDKVYTSSTTLPVQVGTEESDTIPGFNLISAYPNPAVSNTTITYSVDRSETMALSVYDARGRRVLQETLGAPTAGAHQHVLGVDGLSSGVYFYEISTPTRKESKPLLIIH
ncbi:MAG: choice-of-anchor V domain-containing protein [Rhodothermales bacterium]|nr:choice-of-anchor V domain-containing protein [Rhodothermales bacterium]